MRGVPFFEGSHDFRIATGGIKVFPRLPAREESNSTPPLASGNRELDKLIGGPVPWGFGVMIVGPPVLANLRWRRSLPSFAAARGKKVCMYSFEKGVTTLLRRCEGMGIAPGKAIKTGHVQLRRIDPSHVTPGEITNEISKCIDQNHPGMVVIDSLNGYLQAMRSDKSFVVHLHELLAYLNSKGVITILVSAQHRVLNAEQSSFEATYLADLVILLRYFEAQGLVCSAISVVKNRNEEHERAIREFRIGKSGIRVGEPLRQFQGVLTGNPQFLGKSGTLIRENDEEKQIKSHHGGRGSAVRAFWQRYRNPGENYLLRTAQGCRLRVD